MKVSVIIPVFNEQGTILEVIERVVRVPIEKEIIVVDDGSTDGSSKILAQLRGRPGIIVHDSGVNGGKGTAIRIGIGYATGEVVIFQDADLELSPEQYPELLEPILKGVADVVYGSRFLKKVRGQTFLASFANRFLSLLTTVLYGQRITDMETCYKVCRTSILRSLDLRSTGFEIEPEITAKLLRKGIRILEVPIDYKPRTTDEGKKIRWTDGVRAVQSLLAHRFFR